MKFAFVARLIHGNSLIICIIHLFGFSSLNRLHSGSSYLDVAKFFSGLLSWLRYEACPHCFLSVPIQIKMQSGPRGLFQFRWCGTSSITRCNAKEQEKWFAYFWVPQASVLVMPLTLSLPTQSYVNWGNAFKSDNIMAKRCGKWDDMPVWMQGFALCWCKHVNWKTWCRGQCA